MHVGSACGAKIHVHFVGMIHFRGVNTRGLKMNAQPGEDSGNFLSGARHYPNCLGKMQRVKYRIGCGLRQALHAQVAVRSDLADDVTRFIDGRNQQALRRAAPKGNPKVTDIIGLG